MLGEVRDPEGASVLFDAMRVGAGDGAVLGTIHGAGAAAVRERVVSEFGLDGVAFRAADCVVTLEPSREGRRLRSVEEVFAGREAPAFEPLYDGEPTGRVARGQSSLVADLTGPDETYATVRDRLAERHDWFVSES